MLSRRAILRMASPISGATETTSTSEEGAVGCVSTLSVVNRRAMGLPSRRWLASPASSRWLTAA